MTGTSGADSTCDSTGACTCATSMGYSGTKCDTCQDTYFLSGGTCNCISKIINVFKESSISFYLQYAHVISLVLLIQDHVLMSSVVMLSLENVIAVQITLAQNVMNVSQDITKLETSVAVRTN